ncbi:MAG: uracil-DNA glycosylase [Acidobacteriota bacterium]|nr:uracil-DNA glycosylase [Acidobacteriota bacterium]
MSFASITEELASVAEEAREHALYLQELGVENFPGEAGKDRATLPSIAPTPVENLIEQFPKQPASGRIREPQPISGPTMPGTSATPSKGDTLFGKIFETQQAPLPQSNETFEQIWTDIGDCTRCPLAEGRTHVVHTAGNQGARLMFVGEAPGADEDAQARPFVGRAGQLLTKIIEAIGFKREEVLIGNINRCRPPGNRAPLPDEVAACKPFILREIASARPEVIVVLGNTAMKNLLDIKEGITRVRGQFQDYKGIKVMPTFHPAYLLRDPSKKRETWEDLKKVRDYLDGKT